MADHGVPGGVTTSLIRTWHSVYREADEMASSAQAVDLVCMLANYIEPKVFVEAGTYKGHLTFAVANVLASIGDGKIWTADTIDNFSEPLNQMAQERPDIASRVVFYHADFLAMLSDIPEVDMAYIDASSKENEHMRLDHANAVYQKLNVGGLIVVDDTATVEGWDDARKFRLWAQREGIHLGQHRGLTIIQKRNAHAGS